MITGSIVIEGLLLFVIVLMGAFLLLCICALIAYKKDCKKYGKDLADEIWRMWR